MLLEVTMTNEASILCLCEPGRRDIPCWHAAATLLASGHLKPEPTPAVRRRGKTAIALLNGDDERYDELTAELGAA